MSGAAAACAVHDAVKPPRRVRLGAILNPTSGRRDMRRVVEAVAAQVERLGGRLDIRLTERAGHATGIAEELADRAEAVLVAGGDGTIAEVLNGLRGRHVPLAIIPTGTENLLARELNMPRDPKRMAGLLSCGRAVIRDLAEANGRLFASTLGVGFDAECVRRLSRVRRGHISYLTYALPILSTFLFHRFPRLRVEVDGVEAFDDRGFVVMGVISRYAAGLRIAARARHDDGLCDVIAFPCRTRRRLIMHAARALARRHIKGAGVVYRQFRSARITGESGTPIQIDGDAAGELPVSVETRPSSVCYLVEPTDNPPGGA